MKIIGVVIWILIVSLMLFSACDTNRDPCYDYNYCKQIERDKSILNSNVFSLQTTIGTKNSEIARLKREKQELNDRKNQEIKDLNESLNEVISDKDDEIDKLNTRIDELNGEVSRLEEELRQEKISKSKYINFFNLIFIEQHVFFIISISISILFLFSLIKVNIDLSFIKLHFKFRKDTEEKIKEIVNYIYHIEERINKSKDMVDFIIVIIILISLTQIFGLI